MPLDGGFLPLDFPSSRPAVDLGYHATRPHLLASALAAAKSATPHLAMFADAVLPKLPRRPRASQNLRAITLNHSSAPTLLNDAILHPWCAFDSETHRNSLSIDIDHDDALDRWLALPEAIRPALMLDPWSGRAHATAVLQDAVLLKTHAELNAERDGTNLDAGERAALGPQMMADLAGRLLAAALGGTLLPPGSLVKSPWGRTDYLIGTRNRIGTVPALAEYWDEIQRTGAMWAVLPGAGPLKLRDVVAALADRWWHETAGAAARFSKSRFRKKRGDPSWLSRNTFVFDLTRWWAYDHDERDGAAIMEMADRFNSDLASPLGLADVSSIARSIGKFMNGRYRPRHGESQVRRDAEAGIGLDAHGRRQLAGKRSAEANAQDTNVRISTAIAILQASGAVVTNAAIAKLAGVSERTVRRRHLSIGSRTNGPLSGSATEGRPEEPEATTLSESNFNSEPFSTTAADVGSVAFQEPINDRKAWTPQFADVDEVIRLMKAIAEEARKHGSEPVEPPLLHARLYRIHEVREAVQDAERACKRARRRRRARFAEPLYEESIFEDGS